MKDVWRDCGVLSNTSPTDGKEEVSSETGSVKEHRLILPGIPGFIRLSLTQFTSDSLLTQHDRLCRNSW